MILSAPAMEVIRKWLDRPLPPWTLTMGLGSWAGLARRWEVVVDSSAGSGERRRRAWVSWLDAG